MRFEQLEYLIEINKQGSISSAARKLHLSHQALSIAIKNLEEELGVLLLTRSVKGTSLTDEGKQILAAFQEFLHKLDTVTQNFKSVNLHGTLTIGGTNLALEYFLPKTISMYYMKYPHVTIQSLKLLPVDTLEYFFADNIDLAFSSLTASEKTKLLEEHPLLNFHTCMTFQIGVLLPETSPLAHKKSLTLRDLKNKTILYNCTESLSSDPSNADLFQSLPCKQRIYETNRNIYRELLVNNVGIGVTSAIQGKCMETIPKGTVYLPIRDTETRYFGYYVHKEKAFSPLAQSFIEIFDNASLLL